MNTDETKMDFYFENDLNFLSLFSEKIKLANKNHFTPIEVIKKANTFLSQETNTKILDIGSGIGKFCLTAAYLNPSNEYYGIEQREDLHSEAELGKQKLNIVNAHFMHGNIDQLKFKQYNHFYFFNSFHEQLDEADKLDQSISHDANLYYYYNRYFHKQLSNMPSGTKLACFFTLDDEVPSDYLCVAEYFDGKLKCYIKV
jgi:16S rRNA A1518/A1519 N6-dimethyltransferase RsmA/KsgA/DIM1 with predicted DNA glycosylase/AP lyase activity